MQVTLEAVSKRFDALVAVDQVSLGVAGGEFFTLLGPSGCGKTTLLRMVAGFTPPDAGEVVFGAERVTGVPAHKRDTGMVFQNYALFPQLTVFDNVAYGLRARRVGGAEIRRRVGEILAAVQLGPLAERFPGQLSGGQQQRVALARALVIRPRVLLMDEPLSNLDAKLRVSMREEIRRIQRTLGITTLYVTHDQEEAMAVSDRCAILHEGRVQQIGPAEEIYYAPANRFVAEFMGACNVVEVAVAGYDAERSLVRGTFAGSPVVFRAPAPPTAPVLTILLRPEWTRIVEEQADGDSNAIPARVVARTFLGSTASYELEMAGGQRFRLNVPDPGRSDLRREGETLRFRFDPDRPVILTP
jgi:iron(III) transport system ATP-binding protein